MLKSFKEELKIELKEEWSKELNSQTKEINKNILTRLEETRNHYELHNSRLNNIERELRKRNIIIHGLKPASNLEKWNDLEQTVVKFFNEKLEVGVRCEDIDSVRRVGKAMENFTRPVIVELLSWRMKMLIIRNSYKLKDSGMFVSEDYPKDTLTQKKELIPKMLEARRLGKFAIIKYDKLIVKEWASVNRRGGRKKQMDFPQMRAAQCETEISGPDERGMWVSWPQVQRY